MATGREAPIATVAEAQAYPYTDRDRQIIQRERERADHRHAGSGQGAAAGDRRTPIAADELMIITITGDYASRMRSYELVGNGVR